MKRVSVAMTTYNGEKYLKEQLDSLYSQTVVPDEIVVCDDCSKDRTIDILEDYHQKKGLKYYVNSSNLGVNKNFEKAIRLCTSGYVAICDQDDIWFPQKIEILLKKMMEVENGEPCVVSSQSESLNKNISPKPCSVKKDSVGVSATLLYAGNVQGCTLMLNRKIIDMLKPFPESYKAVMMYDCYISFVAATCGVKYNLGQVLMSYRHHDSNVLAKITRKKPFFSRLMSKLKYEKFDRMFPSQRARTLKYVYDEYENVMKNEAKDTINRIRNYVNGNMMERIVSIYSFDEISVSRKIKNIFLEILFFFIPIKRDEI